MMKDDPIIIESDLEGSVSSSLRKGIEYESRSFSSINGDFKLEIIPFIDDSKMKGTSRESLSDKAPFRDSLKTLFPKKPDRVQNLIEKPMSPTILTEAEIYVSYQMREHLSSFVKTY